MATSEIGRLARSRNGAGAQERLRGRLAGDRGPSTASSSDRWVDWGAMADILGQPFDTTSIPLSKLEQMRRDPMIAFGLSFVKLPLIRAPWYIKSEDAQRAQFIDNALRRIYGRFVLAYGNCLDYGYSALVKRFEYMDVSDWKYIDKDDPDELKKDVWGSSTPALVWKPFVALNPRHVSPAWTKTGEFNGINWKKGAQPYFPFENASMDPSIPLEWSLWATNEKDSVFGSLWGYPRTGYSYRYWWAYWYRFGLADRAFEKWADPPVEVYHPTDYGLGPDGSRVDYTAEALALAEKLRSGANVALPSDVIETLDGRSTQVRKWEVRQQESKANFDALNQAFEYLDVQKLRALMVPEQALVEGRGGTSSRNVASQFGDLMQEAQAMVMEEIDDLLNRYVIPQLLEVNFGTGGASCTKVTTGFDPEDIDTMRAIVQGVANATPDKLPVDLRELLGRLGIPMLTPERIKAQLDAQAQAAAEMAPAPQDAASAAGGAPAQAGVTPQGFYYGPRERIDLSRVIERVDELPEEYEGIGATAYFDAEKGILYAKKDASLEQLADYPVSLSDRVPVEPRVDGDGSGEVTLLLARFDDLLRHLDRESPAPQQPVVYMDLIVPEGRAARSAKRVVRDAEGNIERIVDEEEGEEPDAEG